MVWLAVQSQQNVGRVHSCGAEGRGGEGVTAPCDPRSMWPCRPTLLISKAALGFLSQLLGRSLPAEDVNQGLIRYVAHEEMVQETADSFQFLVKDSKLNVVSGNVFHVQRSLLSFTHGR